MVIGKKCVSVYRRGTGAIEKNVLPLTSPAYAAMSFDGKLSLWREALR